MKYYVESYGCTMNFGEGEELAERMDALGHVRAPSADDADIVILNTCTVVETTEKRMIKRMNDLRAAGKEVIVTGCMAKVQPNRVLIRLPGSLVIPPQEYSGFSDAVSERYGCCESIPSPGNATTAIIPIAQGCRGNCTYCITRFARGEKWKKRRKTDMLSERLRAVASLVPPGQTLADIGTDLGELIRLLLTKEGDYRIRIGMMNPNSLKPVLDSLLPVFEDRRVYRFLHIPVQSGSDAVLERMKRHYTVEDFFRTVDAVRERYPDLSIATDLIAGFPGETDEDHRASLALIRRLRADTINITRFSPRPGTAAFKMPQLNGRILKERSTELTDEKNRTEADVNSRSSPSADGSVIARNENYRPIAVKENIPLGTMIGVEVTESFSTYLMGRRI